MIDSREYKHRPSLPATLNILNLVQSLIISCGLLVGSAIVASRITRGKSNTSDFVVFFAYYAQVGNTFLHVLTDHDIL